MMKKISHALDLYDKAMGTCALGIILVLVFYQVVARYFFGSSVRWSEEVSRFIMVYIVFLGLGAGIKAHKHIGIDSFVNMLPAAGRHWVTIAASLVTLLIYVVFAYLSARTTFGIFQSGQVSPAAKIPMALAYFTLPIGFIVGAFRQLEELRGTLQTKTDSGQPADH